MIVTRTVVVRSELLPRKVLRIFTELEGMYRSMVEQLVLYAVDHSIKSFTRLKALKYRDLRGLYPQLPSHYAYTACQDAAARAKSFLRLRRMGTAEGKYPRVVNVSIWLDDHLWEAYSPTAIGISTHRGRIKVNIEPNKHYLRYLNRGWRLAGEAKLKLDRRERRLILYLTFKKEVQTYEPKEYLSVDVNENNVTALIDGIAYLFETNIKNIVLGYHHRRRSIQERYDKVYGPGSRPAKRAFRKLGERKAKDNIRWKVANIIVKEVAKRQAAIVLENLGKRPNEHMIERIKDGQLRLRIFQAAFKGIQKAIEEKAKEYGVPVIYVSPKDTSRLCPIHKAEIKYDMKTRTGICPIGGETWHRDVVAVWNILLRAAGGDGSGAPSPQGLKPRDGRPVPLASTAAHDLTGVPVVVPRGLWERRKFLDTREHKLTSMTIQGRTVS